ncbi:unnamed protein product [Effrenium voratum]|uniref:C3H1-type domain-containing protein n=1 Tax=Effrenium voratum TaxID=2562239 RepID=A0AA36J3M4_9DINO|nr:unnamed protein product [Effrenium voratum]
MEAKLGWWVDHARKAFARKKLDQEQVDQLQSIPGMAHRLRRRVKPSNWEDGYASVQAWVAAHGRLPKSQDNEKQLATWLSNSCASARRGEMPPERLVKLKQIPHLRERLIQSNGCGPGVWPQRLQLLGHWLSTKKRTPSLRGAGEELKLARWLHCSLVNAVDGDLQPKKLSELQAALGDFWDDLYDQRDAHGPCSRLPEVPSASTWKRAAAELRCDAMAKTFPRCDVKLSLARALTTANRDAEAGEPAVPTQEHHALLRGSEFHTEKGLGIRLRASGTTVAELEKRASSRSFLTEVQAPSVGSLGHPELCRKPCILLAHGKCTEGSKCKFCHHAHRTGVKFNKAQREILRSLGEAEALKLLLPYLRVRAKKLPEAQAEPVIQALEQRLQELPEGTPVPANRAAQLSKTLTQMSFRRLILLCRSQEISRAFAELLQIYDADF